MSQTKTLAVATFLFLITGMACQGQVVINAMVADSATLRPLSDVNVLLKGSFRGTTSSTASYFMISAQESDTLVFSRVGYITKQYPVRRLKETLIVYLTEESILLKPVTITGNMIIPGLPQIAKQTSWQNNTTPRGAPIPGFQGIETFGPGYVSRGAISKFSKEAQEKKKLKVVQEENKKGTTYVQIINDPEVKDKLMKDHNLTEEEFYKVLEKFNQKNKDIMYDMEANDLIVFLELFFKENAKK